MLAFRWHRISSRIVLHAFAIAALAACGGSDAGSDTTTTDSATESAADSITNADSSADSTTNDGAKDSGGSDTIVDDTTSNDVVDDATGDAACGCQPDFCGCGACNPADIVCTKTPPGCPLGCVSSCPELKTTVCSCSGDRCVRSGVTGSIACYKDPDCPPGDCCAHSGPVGPASRGTCKPAGDPCCGAGCP